ncbi:LysM peptidoglycan-binding domain-containing protein [Neobacillus sp. OS1-33]|jgi:N-acetyl-anhydromuramyl-L-alanine amidase AmpD|uniref:LysM peptidoglycan-binding domain-containing protein n=1 Tax=Neobacillus sp. OS1-33 TaxID=3070683 RepID=UPI0027DF25CD|nr:LysM peptidoglycan-binding domain-containing protein [Neobacillus sp. OS1-33]WML27348.1 LysM peptidoglycan-binding domain-containing protein [Neobacillus sp. OS1-33]
MQIHVVQLGENLWQIAQRYSTTVQEIILRNNIQNPSMINPGKILSIPFADDRNVPIRNYYLPLQNSKPRTQPITHVVIHFISNAVSKPYDPYNVQDVYRIFINNGVSSHYLIGRSGEVYRLVDENRVAYHAGKGDLPGFPAYKNRLNEYSIGIELLAIGTQDEMLPVMSAQTYQSIAPYNIGYTEAQYRSLNLLLDDIIGRHPFIKRDRQHIVGHDEYAPGRKTDPGKLFDWTRIRFSGQLVHTVKNGESLWSIAQKYGTTINSIASANNINPTGALWVGQELIIPAKSQGRNYTVQSGDSLWKIAQKFGVSVAALAKLNNMSTNSYLYVGQKLTIP